MGPARTRVSRLLAVAPSLTTRSLGETRVIRESLERNQRGLAMAAMGLLSGSTPAATLRTIGAAPVQFDKFQGAHKCQCCHGCSTAKTSGSFPAQGQHDRTFVLWNRRHPPLPPVLSDLQHACKLRMRNCTLKVKGCPAFMKAS